MVYLGSWTRDMRCYRIASRTVNCRVDFFLQDIGRHLKLPYMSEMDERVGFPWVEFQPPSTVQKYGVEGNSVERCVVGQPSAGVVVSGGGGGRGRC